MRFVARLIASLAMLFSAGSSLHAQSAPVIVGSYYEQTVVFQCSSALLQCTIPFSQPPSNQLLNVQRINCLFSKLSQTPVYYWFYPSPTLQGSSFGRNFYFPVHDLVTSGGFTYGAMNETLDALMGSSRFPTMAIVFGVAGTAGGQCTIIGTLQNS